MEASDMTHRIAGFFAAGALLCTVALAGDVQNKPAPDFTLASRAGKPLSLAQYKGQVVMLNFWASWCVPCKQEMPLLETIQKTYGKRGFTLIGVNVEPDSKAANAVLEKIPVSFPVVYDTESKVSKAYEVSGMPSSVFIDRKGQVRMLHRGYKPGDENEYMNEIRALVMERG
jgi:thiol-disulfide isomerase/thioredoxin